MKNFYLAVKTALLGLIPFLCACKVTLAAGGVVSVVFPPLDTVFTSLPAFASTALTWYELVVRVVPTARNYSLTRVVAAVLQAVVPNRAAPAAVNNDVPLSFGRGGLQLG